MGIALVLQSLEVRATFTKTVLHAHASALLMFAACRLTGDGGRRRTTFNPEGSVPGGQRLSVSSLTPPIGSSSNGTGVPVPDFVAQLGIVQEEGGGGSSAGAGARQGFSLASRLSQQALSELKDR
jgi:hypothetical protein